MAKKAAEKKAAAGGGKAKKPAAKKPAVKNAPAKKPAKPAAPKTATAKKVPAKKAAATKRSPATAPKTASKKKATPKTAVTKKANKPAEPKRESSPNGKKEAKVAKPTGFVLKQQQKLTELRDHLIDQVGHMAADNLRNRAEGSEASAFGMHQADAGSDAYDRDFALSLLSKEQDALYEIEEALKRIDKGTYGVCEMSGEKIPHARLEAIPFARFTMECQEQIEKEMEISGYRRVSDMLFGTAEDRAGDEDGDSLDDDN